MSECRSVFISFAVFPLLYLFLILLTRLYIINFTRRCVILIDSHCHLYDPDFESDLDAVMMRAFSEGLSGIIVSGTDFHKNEKAIRMCRRAADARSFGKSIPWVRATVGLSPFLAADGDDALIDETLRSLGPLFSDDSVVGIGECGLDHFYYKDAAVCTRQKAVFERVIALAAETGLPLVIHGRDAESDCLDLVTSYGLKKVVFHSYGGSLETMRRILDRGYFISLSTLVCTSSRHKELARAVDPSRLFLETDSPYLSPRKMKGFPRNEPSFIADSFKKVASLTGLSVKELSDLTDQNVMEFFEIGSPGVD